MLIEMIPWKSPSDHKNDAVGTPAFAAPRLVSLHWNKIPKILADNDRDFHRWYNQLIQDVDS